MKVWAAPSHAFPPPRNIQARRLVCICNRLVSIRFANGDRNACATNRDLNPTQTIFTPDLLRLAKSVVDTARSQGVHIATAESCTGGLVASLLTEIAGASDVFDRGFVVYSNAAKSELLGVAAERIARDGAVSEPVACAMAEGAIQHFAVQVAVSVTGIAGPGGGTAEKPVGLVHIATAREGRATLHERHLFGDIGRSAIRLASVEAALRLLLASIAI
jgi:nicotinamide-nucleotide amidase